MKRIIIAGRTGTGKTTLMNHIAEKYELPVLKTCTDRPRRADGPEDAYHFFTMEEMDDALNHPEEYVMPTALGDYRYVTKKKDLDKAGIMILNEAEIMILDKSGIEYVAKQYPEDPLLVIYCAADKNEVLTHIIGREKDPEEAISRYFRRSKGENAIFTALETTLGRPETLGKQVTVIRVNPFRITMDDSKPCIKRDQLYKYLNQFFSEEPEHPKEKPKNRHAGKEPIPADEQLAYAMKAGIGFRMELKFAVDLTVDKEFDRILNACGFSERPVFQDAGTHTITQTVSFIPDAETIGKYEKIIVESNPRIMGCRFLGFSKIEMVPMEYKMP